MSRADINQLNAKIIKADMEHWCSENSYSDKEFAESWRGKVTRQEINDALEGVLPESLDQFEQAAIWYHKNINNLPRYWWKWWRNYIDDDADSDADSDDDSDDDDTDSDDEDSDSSDNSSSLSDAYVGIYVYATKKDAEAHRNPLSSNITKVTYFSEKSK